MKIIYLASIDVSELNGPATHVKGFASAVAAQHEVQLISAKRRFFQSRISLRGIKHVPVLFPRLNGGWRYFERRASSILMQTKLDRQDIVYVRTSPSRVIANTLSTIECTKVMEVCGIEVMSDPKFSVMMDAMDLILVGTESTRRLLAGRFPEASTKILVHSNTGFDVEHFLPKDRADARLRLGLNPDARIAVHVSGFQPHHDFSTLLKSVEPAAKCHPAYQLILIGYGERMNEVRTAAAGTVADGRVRFTGAVDAAALSDYIAAADVCINAMTQEKLSHGNGNALKTMEYFACGRPVIETVDVQQEVPAWLSNHALCIPPHDVAAMSSAIQEVLDNRHAWETKALSARNELLESHSWSAVVDNTLSLVQSWQSRRNP